MKVILTVKINRIIFPNFILTNFNINKSAKIEASLISFFDLSYSVIEIESHCRILFRNFNQRFFDSGFSAKNIVTTKL